MGPVLQKAVAKDLHDGLGTLDAVEYCLLKLEQSDDPEYQEFWWAVLRNVRGLDVQD